MGARRRHWPDPATSLEAICLRLEGGERIGDILAEAGQPSRGTLRSWLTRKPELGARFRAAQDSTRARLARAATRFSGRPSGFDTVIAEAICDAIVEGGTRAVELDPTLPDRSTIYRWLKSDRVFARDYALARELYADRILDEVWEVARVVTPDTVAIVRLQMRALMLHHARAASRKYEAERWAPSVIEAARARGR